MTNSTTFEGLYSQHFTPFVHFVQGRFQMSREVAEDIVQGVFLTLWEDNPQVEGIEQPSSYVRGCIAHAALNYWRHERVIQQESIDLPVSASNQESESREGWNMYRQPLSVEDEALLNIQLRETAQALAQMPVSTQVMMHMTVAGYPRKDIHRHLVEQHAYAGNEHSITVRVNRARQKLNADGRYQKAKRRSIRRNKPHTTAWNMQYPRCVVCGTTDHPHAAEGRCKRCYSALRYLQVKSGVRVIQHKHQWSRQHAACVQCGTTAAPHEAQGKCRTCYHAARIGKHGAKKVLVSD